jgi:hypothetical protein
VQVTLCQDNEAVGVNNIWGKQKGGVDGKNGYIYASSGDLWIHLVRFVG